MLRFQSLTLFTAYATTVTTPAAQTLNLCQSLNAAAASLEQCHLFVVIGYSCSSFCLSSTKICTLSCKMWARGNYCLLEPLVMTARLFCKIMRPLHFHWVHEHNLCKVSTLCCCCSNLIACNYCLSTAWCPDCCAFARLNKVDRSRTE